MQLPTNRDLKNFLESNDENAPLNGFHLYEQVYNELSYLISDEKMITCIMSRLKLFICSLDSDYGIDIELTEENKKTVTDIIPAIQQLHSHFQEVISSIVSERVLHEIALFHKDEDKLQCSCVNPCNVRR